MKKSTLLFSISLLILTAILGNDLKQALADGRKNKDKIQANPVCFNRDVLPIFIQYCASSGCHDQQTHLEGLRLDNYTSIRAEVRPGEPDESDLYQKMTENEGDDHMPPSNYPQPSQTQLDLIRTWITEGANETDCSNDPCDTSNVTFSSTIRPIVLNNCLGCHSGSNPAGGLNFSNDATIENNKIRIYGASARINGYVPMPPSMTLNNCYIAQLRIWATEGSSGPCDTSNVTYSVTIQPIIQSQCVSCHSGSNPPVGLDFTNDNLVETNKTRIYGSVAGLTGYTAMPPGMRSDSCSIAKIRIWAYPVTNEPCDTLSVTYSETIKTVIQLRCLSCHSGQNAPTGLDFSNDNIVKSSKTRIYGAIAGISGYIAMPPSIPLDTCSAKKIRIWAGTSDIQPCDTSNVTFNSTIRPIVQSQCISCHSGVNSPLGLDFTQDSIVDMNKGRIYGSVEKITGYTPMPPSISLDSCLIKQIKIWASKVDNKPCDTTNVTFAGTIKPILNSQCISCHNGANSPLGLDFTKDSISESAKLRIYGSIAKLNGYIPMPPGLSLDTCSIKQIKIWATKIENKPCDTTNVTFAGTIKPILASQCNSCHSGANPPMGLDFTNDNLVESAKTRIFGAVAKIDGYIAMPPSMTLDTCSVKQIRIWTAKQDSKPCDTTNVTYEGDIKPIVVNNCASCHKQPNPPRGLDFTEDASIINARKTIYAASAHLNGYIPMPPGSWLDSCMITKLKIWSSVKDTLPCDTTNFSYSTKIKPIMEGNCTSCHSGGEYAPNGLDFEIDSISEKNKVLINCAVSGGENCSPMPPSGEMLDSCALFLINLWSNMPTSVEDIDYINPNNLVLYPNPTEGILNIKYFLPEPENVLFEVYDVRGKRVIENNLNKQTEGYHTERIELNGILPPGSYMLRLKIGNKVLDKSFNHFR